MEKETLLRVLERESWLKTPAVIRAFHKVKREDFVPAEYKDYAYADIPLPIMADQTISQPMTIAFMTEALQVEDGNRILEVGSGSGYQAAILAELTPKGEVYTIETIPTLADFAKTNLKDYENVHVTQGDGSKGWKQHAPYERIMITAACPEVPKAIIEQLADNGRLVAPVGGKYQQDMILITKKNGKIKKESLGFPCVFVPLKGEFGWKEEL